jgi:hypothetical protein
MMPVARYFLFAGGALLALLYAFDAFSPKAVADSTSHASAGVDKATLRIRSDVKWPERIVFDTTQPTIVPKAEPAQVALADPEPAPEISAKARVRETFAQFVPVESKQAEKPVSKQAEKPVQRKRKIAKIRPSQPMGFSQPTRFAQQSRYGFFGPSTW